MSAQRRYRVMHKFWLDISKDDEDSLDEQIAELKQTRRFTTTIRDGIRLICDLRKGRVDVLFELFPWVKAEFLAGVQPQETAGERALREQLKRIEQQLLQQGNMPLQLPSSAAQTGPKAMTVPPFENPAFDDEDDLVIKKDTSTNSAQNFLNAMLGLQQ